MTPYPPHNLSPFSFPVLNLSPATTLLTGTLDIGSKTFMDDEMLEIEQGELDLLGLEYSCIKKISSSIPALQIQLLKETLTKAKDQNKLGVLNIHKKEKLKLIQESKKRGRKSLLQRINVLGSRLVESGQYDQLTEFFPSSPSSQ